MRGSERLSARQKRSISPRQPRPSRLTPQNSQLVAKRKKLQLLRPTHCPNSHTSANRFRTTRYTNDLTNQPSLDHDKSAEPTELDARESRGRVCEPYGGIDELAGLTERLPRVRGALFDLAAAPDSAWRAYACGVLAAELAEEEE